MNFHGGFYLSGNTLDYKMTHWLLTLFQIISNIFTSSVLTFSVICTFYFYIAFKEHTFYQKHSIKCVENSLFYSCIAFEELTFDQKCSIKCVLYSLFYRESESFIYFTIKETERMQCSSPQGAGILVTITLKQTTSQFSTTPHQKVACLQMFIHICVHSANIHTTWAKR